VNRFPLRLYLFALLGWTFDFYDLALLGFVKHPVGQSLHLTANAESWMLGIALGTSGIGGIVAGALADRFGKRDILAATVLLYSAGSLISGLAPNFLLFALGRAVVGFGVGGEWAIGHGMLAEAVEARFRGRASALLQAGEPLGVAVAAFAGYVLVPHIGWRWVMVGSAATALLAFFMRRSMHLPNTPGESWPGPKVLFDPRVWPKLLLAWILGVFKLGTYWSCYTWLPTFLITLLHQSVTQSLGWMVTAQSGQFLGMMGFGQVADKFGRRPAFTAFSLLTGAALTPLAFAGGYLATHGFAFWASMFALGVGSGCTAGFGALLAELFPAEVRSMAMGTVYNCARTAQLAAPPLVAMMVGLYGLRGGLGVPLAFAIATASWVWTLPETRGIALGSLGLSVKPKIAAE
jgi:MFS transporter, putative metabolite:H+ symporter